MQRADTQLLKDAYLRCDEVGQQRHRVVSEEGASIMPQARHAVYGTAEHQHAHHGKGKHGQRLKREGDAGRKKGREFFRVDKREV